jgi:hypothetical protein
MFWIVVYCLHANFCYVSQDIPGVGKDAIPHRYPTAQACAAALSDGREIHKNSTCHAVWSVNCFNGGSRCTFDAGDSPAGEKLKHMAPLPQEK